MHQNRQALRLARDDALELIDRLDCLPVDGKDDIADLNAGARRHAPDVLDNKPLVDLGVTTLLRAERAQRQSELRTFALAGGRIGEFFLLSPDRAEPGFQLPTRALTPDGQLDALARRRQANHAREFA